jgi:SAM-dependent methyltransferase
VSDRGKPARLLSWIREATKFAVFRIFPSLARAHHRPFDNSARRFMEERILPALSRPAGTSVLFVGSRSYTYHYRNYFLANGVNYWTADIDPAARVWGERKKHIVGDIQSINRLVPPRYFDIVMLNGVFGYGVNTREGMDAALRSIHTILKPSGTLLLGWNRGRVVDPETLESTRTLFYRGPETDLPLRVAFPDHSHVYDLFLSRPESSAGVPGAEASA